MDETTRSRRILPPIVTSSSSGSSSYASQDYMNRPRESPHSQPVYETSVRPPALAPFDHHSRSSLPFLSQPNEPESSSSGSRFRPSRSEFAQFPLHNANKLPLPPYDSPREETRQLQRTQQQWLEQDRGYLTSPNTPIFPPPPRPPPPRMVTGSSSHNPSRHDTPASRSQYQYGHSQSPELALSLPQSSNQRSMSHHSRSYPTSVSYRQYVVPRSEQQFLPPPPQSQPSSAASIAPTYYSEPLARVHSHESQHSTQSLAMQREFSGGSSISGSSQTGGSSSIQSGQYASMGGYKRKRTRALMTHMQQSGLMSLWKKTKFPTGAERETLGQTIGLTPRQVQVWFQNQRQKGRKALAVNGGIPEGEDPADYEELQKSPRSRRLSLEGDERISAWAGSSASSNSTRLLLDLPSTAGSGSFEPLIAHRGASSHGYQDESSSRNAIGPRSQSPYDKWGSERSDSDTRSRIQHQHQQYHHHRKRSNSYHLPQKHQPQRIVHPPRQHSHHSGSHSTSTALASANPRWISTSPTWQRTVPSVLEPAGSSRSPHSLDNPTPFSPPTTSTGSSSRPNTQPQLHQQHEQEENFWSPVRRRKSSPSIIPESIKSVYPGNVDPSAPKDIPVNKSASIVRRMRYSRSRSYELPEEEEHHRYEYEKQYPNLKRTKSTHLPPELARIALSGPLTKHTSNNIQGERQEYGFNLPGIVQRSSSSSPKPKGIPMDDVIPRQSQLTSSSSPTQVGENRRNEDDRSHMSEKREGKKPMSSNLSSLLD
ncbi:uncharacterized protein IL334_000570 [Kwoniella shivajii]|uniref:Homeobox domain-containing protein n=1 Tax=Kwoniella shivajii TaxID=564305 RepID=A0ABZ1CQJ4_9TREE|nr:hypothetical protein IL334_000570 [Kwoniella shivajii]